LDITQCFWQLVTNVSGEHIRPIMKGEAVKTVPKIQYLTTNAVNILEESVSTPRVSQHLNSQ
jgi:hypothetical protein